MNRQQWILDGESFISLQYIGECYAVKISWLQQAYELGLLGPGRELQGEILLATHRMDRVAEILRLRFRYGLDLRRISRALDSLAE